MKENELVFDKKKHILYSNTVKKVILKHLSIAYSNTDAEEIWENIQKTYLGFLEDMEKQATSRWGDGFLATISMELKNAFPNVSRFSVQNLKSIRYWYKFYNSDKKW